MKPFSGDVYLSEIWVTLDRDDREAKVNEQLNSFRRTLDRPISKIMAAQQMDEYDMSDLPW